MAAHSVSQNSAGELRSSPVTAGPRWGLGTTYLYRRPGSGIWAPSCDPPRFSTSCCAEPVFSTCPGRPIPPRSSSHVTISRHPGTHLLWSLGTVAWALRSWGTTIQRRTVSHDLWDRGYGSECASPSTGIFFRIQDLKEDKVTEGGSRTLI